MSDRIAVFEKGQCVQVGTPYEIYHEPVNAFVADFIGDTNLFKASIKGKKAEIAGLLTLNLDQGFEGAYVSIRPQDIRMTQCNAFSSDKAGNFFEGLVKKRTISGHTIEYEVKVKELIFKVIQLNGNTGGNTYQVGKKVDLTIASKNIKVLRN
jgi:ABC-type Fe3+/spermidine/putrescine transport system ATPase subunit